MREKTAWLCLVTTIAVYVPYFAYVCRLLGGGGFRLWAVLGALLVVIVIQSMLAGVAAVLLTFRQRDEPRDERDAAIEARAYRSAYFVIAGLCSTLAISLPGLVASPGIAHGGDRGFTLLLASQVLLLCFVLAEATRYFTLAIGYRRGLTSWIKP